MDCNRQALSLWFHLRLLFSLPPIEFSFPQKALPDEKPCSINKPSIGGNIVKKSYSVLGPACPSIQAFLKVSETSINSTIFGMDVFATILLEYPGNTP